MWWNQRFTQMRQDFPNRPQVGDEADQPDITATVGTRQRKLLTHPCQKLAKVLLTVLSSNNENIGIPAYSIVVPAGG